MGRFGLVFMTPSFPSLPHQPLRFTPAASAPDPKNHHIIKFGTNIRPVRC